MQLFISVNYIKVFSFLSFYEGQLLNVQQTWNKLYFRNFLGFGVLNPITIIIVLLSAVFSVLVASKKCKAFLVADI